MKYKAFISYSHKDEKFAKWLHTKLESYKIPKELYDTHTNLPKKIFPIFRDIDELPASSDLSEEILEALNNSEYLIVICSPHSAQSQWVNKEIIDFKFLHGEEKVLSIILDGEPYDKEKECFPEALKYKVVDRKISAEKSEPIAADVRGKWRKEWEFGKLKLISGLLELDFEELNKREEKRRQQRRFIWGVVSLIIIASLSGLAWYSFVQKNKAEGALEDNFFQQGLIYKNYLDNPMYAKVLFSEVLKNTKTKEKSARIIYNTTDTNIKIKNIITDEYILENLPLFKKNNSLYPLIDKKNLSKYFTGYSSTFWKTKFLSKKNYLLSWSYDKRRVKLWDLKTKKEIFSLHYISLLEGITFSDDENLIALWSQHEIVIIDTENGNIIFTGSHNSNSAVEGVKFSRDGNNFVSWSSDKIIVWDIKSHKEKYSIVGGLFSFFNELVFTHDDRYLISCGYDGEVVFWHKETGVEIKRISYGISISGISVSPKGRYLLVWYDKNIELIDIRSRKKILKPFKQKEKVEKTFFSQNGKYIFSFTSNGDIYIIDRTTMEKIKYIKVVDGLLDIVFDVKTKKLFTKDIYGIREWEIVKNKRIKRFKKEFSLCCFNSKKSKKYFINWENRQLNIMALNNKFEMYQFDLDDKIEGVEFTKNDDEFLIWSDKKIILWNITTHKKEVILEVNNTNINEVISFDNGKLIMVRKEITKENYKNEYIQVYDIKTKIKLFGMMLDEHSRSNFQGGYSQNSFFKKNIFLVKENIFLLWNKKDGLRKQFIYLKSILGQTSSLDESYFLLWDSNKVIAWDSKTKKKKLVWLDKNIHTNQNIERVILDEEGENIFIIYSNFIRVIDSESYKEKSVLNQLSKEDYPMEVLFTKDKKQILVWHSKNIKLWDIATKKVLVDITPNFDSESTIGYISKVFFDEKEKNIISISDKGKIEIYSIYTDSKTESKYYLLKTQVETGYFLSPSGEVKSLTAEEWRKKKAQYEKILIKSKKD